MKVIVVGSIGIDDIETPFAKADGVLGGSATYASIASAFHASTGVVSIVGQDFSAEQRRLFSDRGIDLAGVHEAKGKTFRWGGRYHANYDHRDTTFTELNVLSDFDPEIPKHYRDSRYVLLGNLDPLVQLKVLDQLLNPEIVVIDTMNYWLESAPDQVNEAIERSDVAVINEEEVRLYSGYHSIPKAAEHMMDRGLRAVVIKLGAYGAAMRTREGWFFVAGYPLMDVKDPTGAGDSLAGGFIGYLAREDQVGEQSLRRAVVHGSVLASLAVQSFGAEGLAGASRGEIESRYQDFLRFSQVDIEKSIPQPAKGASD